jgi:hypothetical protein
VHVHVIVFVCMCGGVGVKVCVLKCMGLCACVYVCVCVIVFSCVNVRGCIQGGRGVVKVRVRECVCVYDTMSYFRYKSTGKETESFACEL